MTPIVRVGTILIEERPLITRTLDLESESYAGKWGVLKVLNGSAFDQEIRSAGWNCFFMAEEVKVTVLGSLSAKSIQKALKRIFLKVQTEGFNCLEVTKMVENRFIGMPYVTVCTHPRHIQQGCLLDSDQERDNSKRR